MTTKTTDAHPMDSHPGVRRLERFAFGPPDNPAVSADDRRHFERCAQCLARISELRSGREAFLEEHPVEVFTAEITAAKKDLGSHEGPIGRLLEWPRVAWLAPLAAALLLALGVGVYNLRTPGARDGALADDILFKGDDGLRFEVFVSRGGAPAALHSGEPLARGDVLRFGVLTREDGYLFIANIDDQGRTATYYPQNGDGRIVPGKMQLPNETIALDDFVGDELIAAVLSPTPLAEATIREALERAYDAAGGDIRRIRTLELEGDIALKAIRKVEP